MIAGNPLPEQLTAIGWAVLIGFALGAFYALLRLLRRRAESGALTFALDILFSLVSCAAVFLLVTGVAQIPLRGFLLIGLSFGWLAWEQTVGCAARWLAAALRKAAARRRTEKIGEK